MSMYTAPSQITERQLAYFANKKVLMAGEIEDEFCAELVHHCQSLNIFTTHFGYQQKFERHQGIDSYFGAELTHDVDADLLLFYWPKAKQEAQYLLAMLMAKLGQGTEVIVVGENRSGVKSIEKFFQPFGQIRKFDSARRCSFYYGECSVTPPKFSLNEWFQSYTLDLATLGLGQDKLTIKTLPGVFSHGELDLGTQLLLQHLPQLQNKESNKNGNDTVLDVGCGAGVIGAVIAHLNPHLKVSMCDVSALALESTKATLAANGLSAQVIASDVYSHIEEKYQAIITNPPFHSGLDTHYSASETLISQAPNYLAPAGELVLVANRFLKYPALLQAHFSHFETLEKTTKFSLYRAY